MNKEPWCIEEGEIVRPASANRDGVTTRRDCNRAILPSHCLKVKLIKEGRDHLDRFKNQTKDLSHALEEELTFQTSRIDGASGRKDCPSRTFPLFSLQGVSCETCTSLCA